MQISIDTDEVKKLTTSAGDILLSASAEDSVLRLLELKETVDMALSQLKATLEEEALKISDNFQSIRGEHIKVSYRSFGPKYELDEAFIEKLPEELVERRIKYSLNSQVLKQYIKDRRKLPLGITPTDRRKVIVIGRVNEK